MTDRGYGSGEFDGLRRRAEEVLGAPGTPSETDPADAQELFHELRVHQLGLEMQNEELLRVRQELEKSRERCRRLYDHAPIGYLTLDAAGTVAAANLTLASILLTERSRLLGQSIGSLLAGGSQARFYRMISRGEADQGQFELKRSDGVPCWVLLRVEPVLGGDGELRQYWCSLIDITEQMEALLALERSREELEQRVAERTTELARRAGQLSRLASELTLTERRERHRLAMVLHDHLQQLLVGAKFALEVALRQTQGETRQSVQHAVDLLMESLAASKNLTVELSPPILHDHGLAAALEWLGRWMLEKNGLEVDISAAPEAVVVREDMRVLLFESARELLLNVVKHAGVAKARLELARREGELCLSVQDEGAGFDPEDLLGSENGNDTKFGLLSIRERLDLLGGRLEIDAAAGKGARFDMVVPLASATPPAGRAASAEPANRAGVAPCPADSPAGAKTIRVLLADDHAVVRRGISALLAEEPDLEVVGEATDGIQAVELARKLRPDVVLMDYGMPRMDGLEATRAICAECPDIRVIGLSMYEQADRADAMLQAGAAMYLTKSGDPAELIDAIRGG